MPGLSPANAEHFYGLLAFAKKVFALFEANGIDFVVYGSFALFYYTKDASLSVNDIDVMVPVAARPRLVSSLREKGVPFEASGDGLFIRDGESLIEVDEWGLGNQELAAALEKSTVHAYGLALPLVSLKSLELIYSLAKACPHNNDAEKIKQRIAHLESFLGRPLRA
ncbi:hypothetical protein JXA12_01490 [Candidatus Woesearchaeota archaeon]|nr:hypothetical protein [Candidatus Woesearchaeota archaeon]